MWYYGRRIRIEPDWNVKMRIGRWFFAKFHIRIEPDWNVKCVFTSNSFRSLNIRIEPDWNVKKSSKGFAKFKTALE